MNLNHVKSKVTQLENEKSREKVKEIVIDIIVDLEKFCHSPEVDVHGTLLGAYERCRREIDKDYGKIGWHKKKRIRRKILNFVDRLKR